MTATQEMFDCGIDELTLSARTRGALSRAGITTLSGLEQALLDDALPGIGPKAGDDIDHALDLMQADTDRRLAAAQILAAQDAMANLLMLTADLAIDGPGEGRVLNGPELRKQTAKVLREKLQESYAALRVLAPELPEAVA